MMDNPSIPDIEILTPEQKLWSDVVDDYKAKIKNFEQSLKVCHGFLEYAENKLKELKAKD